MTLKKETMQRKKEYKIIENHLRNYNSYLIGIKNMHKQMDYLMPSMTASYEVREESIGAFVFSSSTEKYAIDRIESKRALQLHEDIVLYELIVNSINDGIAQLEHEEKAFIELRYFKNQTITATAANLGYSERQIFSIRKNVMGKLLISLKNIVKLRII